MIHLINLKWEYQVVREVVESGVKDFGVISVENGYQIFIGGNGTDVTVGKLLTTVETEDEVIQLCGASCSITEKQVFTERTAPWLERMGFEMSRMSY